MEISNWIALGALFVAVFGLIPQFYQILGKSKTKKSKDKKTIGTDSEKSDIPQKPEEEKKPMPFMMRILVLVIFAFASLLIEMILFGIVANIFGVGMNLGTMTLIWKIIFYSLFLIPGAFLFLAFVVLSANMDD